MSRSRRVGATLCGCPVDRIPGKGSHAGLPLLTTALCLVLLVFVGQAYATFLPMDHPAYRDIDALQVRGYAIVSATTLRPYTRRQIAGGLARIATELTELSPYERRLVERLMAEFAPDREDGGTGKRAGWWLAADINPRLIAQQNPLRLDQPRPNHVPASTAVPRTRARNINTLDLAFRIAPGLTTGHRFEMDTDGLADNDYRGRAKTYRLGSTGQVAEAYVQYEAKWGKLSFGRIPLVWGPERQGNLLLSENAPALDMLSVQADVRWLHFAAFTGEMESQWGTGGLTIKRFLAGHRLVLTPARWLEIGAAETVVYGGPDKSLSLRWSNPLAWYYAEEVNAEIAEENLLASGDLVVRPLHGVETYAALLMDDIAFDKLSPDKIGWTIGLRWEAPLGWDRAGLGVEYTRLTRWVYNYARDATYLRYTHKNAALGHYLGPDGDALFLTTEWESRPFRGTRHGLRVAGLFTHRRQGETRFFSPYPISQPSRNIGYRYDPFPFGIVETTTSAEVLVSAPPLYGLTLTGALLGQTMRHAENKNVPRRWEAGFRLDLDWHIPVRW